MSWHQHFTSQNKQAVEIWVIATLRRKIFQQGDRMMRSRANKQRLSLWHSVSRTAFTKNTHFISNTNQSTQEMDQNRPEQVPRFKKSSSNAAHFLHANRHPGVFCYCRRIHTSPPFSRHTHSLSGNEATIYRTTLNKQGCSNVSLCHLYYYQFFSWTVLWSPKMSYKRNFDQLRVSMMDKYFFGN